MFMLLRPCKSESKAFTNQTEKEKITVIKAFRDLEIIFCAP